MLQPTAVQRSIKLLLSVSRDLRFLTMQLLTILILRVWHWPWH